jgi:glycerol kinase
MAAGNAEGIDVWSLDSLDQNGITSDTFTPAVSESGTSKVVQLLISGIDCVLFDVNYTDRDSRYTRWKDAVKRTLGWETILDDGSADPGKSVDLN